MLEYCLRKNLKKKKRLEKADFLWENEKDGENHKNMTKERKLYKSFTPLEKASDKTDGRKDIAGRPVRKSFSDRAKKQTFLTGFTLRDLPEEESRDGSKNYIIQD